MLDIKFVTENLEMVNAALKTRSGNYTADSIAALNIERRDLLAKVEVLKADRNRLSQEVGQLKREKKNADELMNTVRGIGDTIKQLDERVAAVESELNLAALSVPNLPHESVPVGASEENNVVVRAHGTPRVFGFEPKAHWDIGESLGILDFAAAAKVSGSRFAVYRGLGARLERAIYNFMLDTHAKAGYTEIIPPYMVNRDSMTGTGQLPKFEEDAFKVANNGYFLVPTAEVPVTNLHRAEILDTALLPIKYTAYTACFRAEAGSAGRDTRGLIRQHQFNKVELVKFCLPENSYAELEGLTADAEKILQLLGIPYRVSLLCTGDVGFSSAKTYDIEVWMPSYGRYVEISSCSNFEAFQARRMNIKYRDENGKLNFVHTLNGSGLAVGRTTAAILENFQTASGSVTIPPCLVPYMGTEEIKGN